MPCPAATRPALGGRLAAHRVRLAAAAVVAGALLAGCQSGGDTSGAGTDAPSGGTSEAAPAAGEPEPVRLRSDALGRSDVSLDEAVTMTAQGARLTEVRVVSDDVGRLDGELVGDWWRATGRLEPGATYSVQARAERSDGTQVTRRGSFTAESLTLDEQTFASVAPLEGETVGVGMPVVVTFDLPVEDKASFERHMTVSSTPSQPGAWHWLSDTEAHWRPKTYWRAGTDVAVDLDINSLPAGAGIYGQEDRSVAFQIGDAVVSKVDVASHQMRTYVNGQLARTMPISAGKAGWETRSGTKVIIEKFRRKRMDASTIGVSEDDPEYYNLANVEYAMRVTYSGEFIHAAPWSTGSQGSANVSHGCVGMSTADARWLYERTRRGDVVEVTGTQRRMSLTNGYGDWNLPFAKWREGSALT